MELSNGDTVYHIRYVPREEWKALLDSGTVFYDYTKLTAANMCPTWGVVRYGLHKTEIPLTMGGRNLPIECGSACHDFFAALRAWTLPFEEQRPWAYKHFGDERALSMFQVPQDSDRVNNAQLF